MHYSRAEFEKHRAEGRLTISLIGMSGMGKSWRARHLAEIGFANMDCDALIAARIAEKLHVADVRGLATWMGQPWEDGYAKREREYLDLESETLAHVLGEIHGNTVIDTTGSVVYLPQPLQERMREKTLVVLLEANESMRSEMFERFLQDPKPIVWGHSFSQRAGESEQEALARSYPELLAYRTEKYRALADVVIPYDIARDKSIRGQGFLQAIETHLVS